MKEEQDYIRDISEIRSMMERSSKFLSLSGWAGVMAGIYALAGVVVAYFVFGFSTEDFSNNLRPGNFPPSFINIIILAIVVLVLAVGTAIFLSGRQAIKRGDRMWNPTSRRLLIHMAVPLFAGGIFCLILLFKGFVIFLAPATLIFYGIALFNAGNFSFDDIKSLGVIQVVLGLLATWFVEYSIFFWAAGFGLVHIFYGIMMHYKYER